jgi:trigger factor
MLEREIDHALAGHTGPVTSAEDLQRRLQWVGKSEEELRAEVREEAEEKVRRSLTLTEFAEAEHVDVTPKDIEAEIDRMAEGASEEQAQQLKLVFGTDNGREVIRRSLFTRKALDRLVEIASAEAETAPKAPAARKSPRRAPRSAASAEAAADESTENSGTAEETAAGS